MGNVGEMQLTGVILMKFFLPENDFFAFKSVDFLVSTLFLKDESFSNSFWSMLSRVEQLRL